MNVSDFVQKFSKDKSLAHNIAAWQTFPARQAQLEPFPDDLAAPLIRALKEKGIDSLFSHQATAYDQIRQGQNPVIVTSTASGKTLCYNLPVLDCLLSQPGARALYLFPTKALAQDQKDGLNDLLLSLKEQITAKSSLPTTAVYDGDTPPGQRLRIRSKARIIISNPDMLHTAILPHHPKWAEFFRQLRFVVIDEIHTYRGVFGSHVANVIRRLKRITGFYGSFPRFILTSATIANPKQLAEKLIEDTVFLVENDGSPQGEKHFLIYNPPIVNHELGLRRSSLLESVRLGLELFKDSIQTIIFGRSRGAVELILSYLRNQAGQISLRNSDPKDTEPIRAYRGGYLPSRRREIEQELREGIVKTVVATNALELGIDIGGMGAAILAGYPGTIAASLQQAGRSGRQSDTSLAVLVATASPLDQYLAHHPEYFFGRSPEKAFINPNHLLILLQHLRCAAFELPFSSEDGFGRLGAEDIAEYLQVLEDSGVLHRSANKYFWMADRYPAEDVSLRSASLNNVVLQAPEDEGWQTIGQVDRESAFWMVHPGAIYIHEGQTYFVDDLDLAENVARLHLTETGHYTEARRETTVELVNQIEQSQVIGVFKSYGELTVTTQVTGFFQIRWFTHERLGQGELNLPPTELQTTGYWLSLTEETVDHLRRHDLWKNDPNDYGANWAEQRNKARARDGYCCQLCGRTETGRVLDVHHKIPFRNFKSAKEANQLSNLVSLCKPCHRQAETTVKMKSGLAGLAFVLGHLAPLFLMCDRGDIGVHSDPASPLSSGRPTVVVYDQYTAGIGLSEKLYEFHEDLAKKARELIFHCQCADGCPSCVGPAGEDGVGGKLATLAILKAITSELSLK